MKLENVEHLNLLCFKVIEHVLGHFSLVLYIIIIIIITIKSRWQQRLMVIFAWLFSPSSIDATLIDE